MLYLWKQWCRHLDPRLRSYQGAHSTKHTVGPGVKNNSQTLKTTNSKCISRIWVWPWGGLLLSCFMVRVCLDCHFVLDKCLTKRSLLPENIGLGPSPVTLRPNLSFGTQFENHATSLGNPDAQNEKPKTPPTWNPRDPFQWNQGNPSRTSLSFEIQGLLLKRLGGLVLLVL